MLMLLTNCIAGSAQYTDYILFVKKKGGSNPCHREEGRGSSNRGAAA